MKEESIHTIRLQLFAIIQHSKTRICCHISNPIACRFEECFHFRNRSWSPEAFSCELLSIPHYIYGCELRRLHGERLRACQACYPQTWLCSMPKLIYVNLGAQKAAAVRWKCADSRLDTSNASRVSRQDAVSEACTDCKSSRKQPPAVCKIWSLPKAHRCAECECTTVCPVLSSQAPDRLQSFVVSELSSQDLSKGKLTGVKVL